MTVQQANGITQAPGAEVFVYGRDQPAPGEPSFPEQGAMPDNGGLGVPAKEIQTAAQRAAGYVASGIAPIPLPHGSKAPRIPEWQKLRLRAETVGDHFTGAAQNIGGLMGSASGGIVDIDFDWPEAALLGEQLLPRTWTFGRAGLLRHALVKAPEAKTLRWDAPVSMDTDEDGRRVVELLSDGAQVMLPGSLHPTGGPVEWICSPEQQQIAEVPRETLESLVNAIAAGALLVRVWSSLEGSRHHVTLALTGALYHAGWESRRIEKFLIQGVLQVLADPERVDRERAVRDTLAAASAGKSVNGLPSLAALLPPDVLALLTKWLRLGTGVVLTSGGLPLAQPMQPMQPTSLSAAPTSARALQGVGSQCSQYPPGAQVWPDLIEFSQSVVASGQEYPTDRLGPLLGGAVRDLVARQQVPTALAAQAILASASTVTQAHFDVECDGRVLPLSLWLVFVGAPGERKTSTDDIAFDRVERQMREGIARYRVALRAWKDAGDGDPGPKPRNPTLFLRDTTSEGLIKTLDLHWPALTLTNSDAAAWVGGYSMREGRDSSTAATLSALWSGTAHSQARASQDEPSTLFHRRLSLSLMLQPGTAAGLFGSQTLAGQGFLSRCLPSFPATRIGDRPYQKAMPSPGLDAFYRAQEQLLAQVPPMSMITGELHPVPLQLTPEAFTEWVHHHDRFERELAGEYQSIVEVANKAPEQILRLAGVRAALEGHSTIEREFIVDAAALVDWYNHEWLAMVSRLAAHKPEVVEPQQLFQWMRKRREQTGESTFTSREMCRSGPRLIRNASDKAKQLLGELIRRGYVRYSASSYELRPEAAL